MSFMHFAHILIVSSSNCKELIFHFIGVFMRICELRNKQVILVCDGKILGYTADINFDACNGCIQSIVVPGPAKLCGLFGHDIEYIIPFKCIKCIGKDTILVDVCLDKVSQKCSECKTC